MDQMTHPRCPLSGGTPRDLAVASIRRPRALWKAGSVVLRYAE